MKRTTLLIAVTLLLSACSNSEQASTSTNPNTAAPATEKITIAQFGHVFLYMPLYVALNKGLFKKQGLDVNLVSTGGDEKTFAAVSSGNAQFGVSDPTFTAIARERGSGGKVVACLVRGTPLWLVTFNKDIAPATTPSDLNGRKIATYTAPSTCYSVMKKVLDNKGKTINATIVQSAFGSLPALMKANKADMAFEIEPTVSIIEGQGGHVVYSPEKELGDFAFTGLEVSDDYAVKHPEIIAKVVNALNEAVEYIRANFDGAVQVAQKEFPDVDPAVVKNALARLRDSETIPKSLDLPEVAWKNAIALRKEIGDIKGDGDYAHNVDMTYVKALSVSKQSADGSSPSGQ